MSTKNHVFIHLHFPYSPITIFWKIEPPSHNLLTDKKKRKKTIHHPIGKFSVSQKTKSELAVAITVLCAECLYSQATYLIYLKVS